MHPAPGPGTPGGFELRGRRRSGLEQLVDHDGFSMWRSVANEWNSVGRGPRLDLTALFARAYRAKGLKFMVSTAIPAPR